MIMFYEFRESGLVAGLATQHQHSLVKSCRGVAHSSLLSCDGSFGSTSKVRLSRESSITSQRFFETIFVQHGLPSQKLWIKSAFYDRRESQALNNFSQPVVRDLARQLHRFGKRKIG